MRERINQLRIFLDSTKGIWLVITAIVIVNIVFYNNIARYASFIDVQIREDASGFSIDKANRFSYFYYYTGYFPLASLNQNLKFSVEDAHREIKENGDSLIMEYEHWSRLGENARIWAFLPNSFFSGSPQNPSIKLFNAIVFVLSIIILYGGFWRVGKSLYGLVLVLLINLTPFYIYEIFANENIFGLMGSVFFIIVGLNVYSIFKKEILYNYFFLALFSGGIIGFFSEFRNEISIVLLTLILMNLFAKQQRFIIKIFIVLISIASFNVSKQLIRNHFDNKFESTSALVEKVGGHVYTGNRILGHKFWHPVFCGLGDFDEDYGYEWNDRVAYKYATPILQEKYGMDIVYSGKLHLDNYYDKDSLYYIKFDEISEYEQIVKEKVLNQISDDPLWYITIIVKRVFRTMSITTPVPYIGWLLFYLIYFFIKNRQWSYLKLLLISLPLSATSIIIYSGKGATYSSVFVYFVIICLLFVVNQKIKSIKD